MSQRPTPYSIALCALIVLHYEGIAAKEESEQHKKQPNPGSSSGLRVSPLYQAFDDAPDFPNGHPRTQVEAFLQEQLQTVQGNPNAPISALVKQFRSKMKSQWSSNENSDDVVKLFLQWLSTASTTMDSMIDLITSLQLSVTSANPIIDATSVSGMFIRSVCCLGFPYLSFTETCRLWQQFLAQTDEARDSLNSLKRGDESEDANTMEMNEQWSLSAGQMENLLRQECERLGLPGSVVQEGVDAMGGTSNSSLSEHLELPSAHFLRYLQCLQSKERVGAMDALHAYFDHVLIQSQANKQQQQKDHLQILQFAAILLAALHLETGDVSLARLATEEAVRVAQQSPETGAGCVAYSLGWLSQTATAAASGGNDDGAREWMARCVDRSLEEKNLRSLVAGANLARVRHALLDHVPTTTAWGGTASSSAPSPLTLPQIAWNFLFAAATTDGGEAAASTTHHFIPPADRPLHMTHVLTGRKALQTMAQQRLMASAIWDAYNQPSSSGLTSYLALFAHRGSERVLGSNHVTSAIQNLARTALYGSTQSFILNGDDGVQDISDFEDSKQKAVEKDEQEHKCIYAVALQQMSLLRQAFGMALDDFFCQEMALIFHEWAIRRGDINDAQGWMRFLLGNLSPGMNNFAQVQMDVRIQQSLLLQAQEKWDQAKQVLKDQLAISKSAGLPLHTAWILLRIAMLLIESSASKQKRSNNQSYANAVPYLLECLTVCDEHCQDGLHATAMTVLAQVHFRMNRIDPAIAMIEAALPNLLQRGHVWFQAEAYLTMAKCHLKKRTHRIVGVRATRMASHALAQSERLFLRCQDGDKLVQVYYLQANTWNILPGNQRKRDNASQKFLKTREYLGRAASLFQNSFDPEMSDETGLTSLINRSYVQ